MIGTLIGLVPGEVWVALAALAGVLAARFGWKRAGRKEAQAETLQKDIDRAEVLRKRAAAARADADRERDAARFLRERRRLRD